jgi:toxin FitB
MATDIGIDRRPVLLLDTSTAIALIVEDHDGHAATVAAIRGHRLGLAGHAWFETFSVLTRLPGAMRRSPADAVRLLANNFPERAFLGEPEAAALGAELARRGIAGGSVYDALVAAAARHHDHPLLSRDRRALPTYGAMGIALAADSIG